MNPDKILILLAALILSFVIVFKDNIIEDVRLINEIEKTDLDQLTDDFIESYNYPLSHEERIALLTNYIGILSQIQDIASNTLVMKYIVDFRDTIIILQSELLEKQEELRTYGDYIAFTTPKEHKVVTNTEFPRNRLLQLAHMVDQEFSQEQFIHIFSLFPVDDHQFMMYVTTEEDVQQDRLETFGKLVSTEVLEGAPIKIEIIPLDEEDLAA